MSYIGKQPTAVPLSTSDLNDDIISLAKMASGTDGNLITYDASGNPVAVATGNDGQILTSAGAGAPCLFEAAAGGGKIGQMISTQLDVSQTTNSTSHTAITGVTAAITPVATSSKIWVQGHLNWGFATDNTVFFQMFRDSTLINDQDFSATNADTMHASGAGGNYSTLRTVTFNFLDSPSSTSELTYTAKWKVDGNTAYLNSVSASTNKAGTSQWNLLEVLA